jgi:hypothetical protein
MNLIYVHTWIMGPNDNTYPVEALLISVIYSAHMYQYGI